MKDYKRLTKRNYFEGDYCVVPEELSKEIKKWKEQHATEMTAPPVWYHLGERLCQLEDKIDKGSLIEMPRIVRRVDMSCGYEDYLVQWEKDNGKIKSRIYNNERRAKAKLRELKE